MKTSIQVNFHKNTFPFKQDSSIQIDSYIVFPQVISYMDPLDDNITNPILENTYPSEMILSDSNVQLDEIRRYQNSENKLVLSRTNVK